MRTPAAAIAWELGHRHRRGLAALGAWLVVLAAVRMLVAGPEGRPGAETPERFALFVVVPTTATFVYCLAVFTFGFAGDLGARRSVYPARLFTLPVTTAALAGWPMLYGAVTMALLWGATRWLALWPADVDPPTVWPAIMAAAFLAWTQALTWMPYGLPGLRVVAAVLCLTTFDAAVLLALHVDAPETVMSAILAPQLPLAYLVARAAVARARRGDVPDWRPALAARVSRLARRGRRPSAAFASAGRAQEWLEWRRLGLTVPVWVALLLPFELALLFLPGTTSALVWVTLLLVLLTPPVMAALAAASAARAGSGGDGYGLSPFIATRPLTDAALLAATMRAIRRSVLAAWVPVLVAAPVALALSGRAAVVLERARALREAIGTERTVVAALLVVTMSMLWTWRQLAQSLYVGLTGRPWLIRTRVLVMLTMLTLLGPFVSFAADHPVVTRALWRALPVVLALLCALKLAAAAWSIRRLHRDRLVSDAGLLAGAAAWCAGVLALHALLVWFVGTPLIPRHLSALVAILVVPLARVAAAPLALAWNRHR